MAVYQYKQLPNYILQKVVVYSRKKRIKNFDRQYFSLKQILIIIKVITRIAYC